MEKQFNSDTEQTKLDATLISKDGPLQSPGIPSLNLVFAEPGLSCWFVDVGDGHLTFHIHNEEPITPARMKHLDKVWLDIVLALQLRGMEEIDTWIEFDNKEQLAFAEHFGFELTGFLKEISFEDGQELLMEELTYKIPKIED